MNTLRTYRTRTRARHLKAAVTAHHAKDELSRHRADRRSARATVESLHPTPPIFLSVR
ncbi:hypothetical protein [Phycicoccus sp. Soil748]|uniref:hypothetical protein n=1 Tax=Phycicoccus sp. Soil748 TaxID=1736397 RepID=UPI000B295AAF|nr:hypothetical protein [Phycicoccus sp. Soil748]